MTAQAQQSRADFEAFWRKEMNVQAMDLARTNYPMTPPEKQQYLCHETNRAWITWQAARTLPAPENVREGEPYDNPAFEDLARTMGVWGTAQAALCAQFFLAGRGAVPVGAEPTATITSIDEHGPCFEWRQHWANFPIGTNFYTAAQVQAMGRMPPFEADAIAVNLMRLVGLNKHQARECEEVVRFVLAAQQQSAAQSPNLSNSAELARTPLTDEQIDSIAAGQCWSEDGVDTNLFARAIEAAHGITHPTGD